MADVGVPEFSVEVDKPPVLDAAELDVEVDELRPGEVVDKAEVESGLELEETCERVDPEGFNPVETLLDENPFVGLC